MVRASKEQSQNQARHTKTSFLWYHSCISQQGVVLKSQQFESKHDGELKVMQTMLKALQLEKVVFTMDALHCQKNYSANH
jgi:hypothetical protein